jgi:N-acetylneuraminic acid mutarotase
MNLIFKLLTPLLLLTVTLALPAQGVWTQKQDFPYYKVTNCVSFSIGDYAYVGMGDTSVNTVKLVPNFYRYDPSMDTWQPIATFPGKPRTSAITFVVNGMGYVGLGSTTDSLYSDMFRYDPTTDTWTQLNNFAGGARYGAFAFEVNNAAYIGAGVDIPATEHYLNDLWKYDPVADTWENKGNGSFETRRESLAFSINGKGYMVGGVKNIGSTVTPFVDLWEYNPQNNAWTKKLGPDGAVLGFSNAPVFVVNGIAYMCYGTKWHVATYDPVTNKAKIQGDFLGNNNVARRNAVGFAVNGKGYFGLGYQSSWSQPALTGAYKDIWEFTAPVSTQQPLNPDLDIHIAPNPTTGLVNVSGTLSQAGTVRAVLTDIHGRTLREAQWELPGATFSQYLDVTGCTSGTYFLTLFTDNGVRSLPLLVD